jgi:Vitamin K-dependent gamma-carboxylase
VIRLWSAFVARMARHEPGTALAIFRVAFSLVVAGTLANVLMVDVFDPIWLDRAAGGVIQLQEDHWLIPLVGGAGPEQARLLCIGGLIAALWCALGLGHRLAALVCLQLTTALFEMTSGTGGGHDRLITNGLWLLVLAPADRTLSLRARLFTGAWVDPTPVAAWPRYLAVVQLTAMYVTTGIQKLGVDWLPQGGWLAVYYALLLPSWARLEELAWVAWLDPFLRLGTLSTWLFEIGWFLVPLALWFRDSRQRPGRLRAFSNRVDLRLLFGLFGLLLHSILYVLMELGPFSLVTLSFYICLWHPDELRGLLRRLGVQG